MAINNNNTNNNNTTSNNNENDLLITWGNDLSEGFSEELKYTKQVVKNETVKYVDYFTRPNNFIPFEVHWKDIDNFDLVK